MAMAAGGALAGHISKAGAFGQIGTGMYDMIIMICTSLIFGLIVVTSL